MAFGSIVAVAIAMRRQMQWHRRLMLGAAVILIEPAPGRLLSIPLLGQSGGAWLEAALQVSVLGVMARHDAKVLGRAHPATLIAMGAVIGVHALIQVLASTAAMTAIAQAIAVSAAHP